VSIGETLAAARGAAGLTTADVAERTRIRRTLVEAIEADDYRLCGGDVYARGHIGTIARTVGLDPAPILAEFDAAHGTDAAPRATEVFEAETTAQPERRTATNWSAAMVLALVVVILLAGWQLSRGDKGSNSTAGGLLGSPSPSVSRSSTTSASPKVSHPVTSSARSSIIAQVQPAKGVTVKVSAVTGNCWIQAKEGTHVVYEGTLRSGSAKTFTDTKLVKLILGNSGAVHLTVNGRNLGAPAGAGQISKLSFGPGDPTASGG
jgi:cytoskeleton protein RodZ